MPMLLLSYICRAQYQEHSGKLRALFDHRLMGAGGKGGLSDFINK